MSGCRCCLWMAVGVGCGFWVDVSMCFGCGEWIVVVGVGCGSFVDVGVMLVSARYRFSYIV